MPESVVFNEDCMTVMRRYPDQYFDLAVVDPIYGDVKKGGYYHAECEVSPCRLFECAHDYCPNCGAKMDLKGE